VNRRSAPAAATTGDQTGVLERRVRLWSVLGILLTSFVIGAIATVLLYQSHSHTLTGQLLSTLKLHTAAMAAELARLHGIADQITSRTQIRTELERYRRGEISEQRLVEFTQPRLADAMESIGDVVGITRLSDGLQPLVAVGKPIPRDLWPRELGTTGNALGCPADGFIVVAAPIRNRDMKTVGIDLVMFRDDRLRAIMDAFGEQLHDAGSVQIATLRRGQVHRFYQRGEPDLRLADEALKLELMATVQLGMEDELQRPEYPGHARVLLARQPVGGSGWVFVYHSRPGSFFAPARRHALFAALTVLALAVLGIALTSRVIRPLVIQIGSEARKLHHLLGKNEELLSQVRTNEAKLQAILDNAPAVIFIKDRDGKYLLVNSSYEQLVRMPRDRIVGKYDYQLFPEDIAKSTRDTDLEVLRTGRSISVDERAPHPDGMHDYLSTKFPLFDTNGDAYAVCGISTDITPRKQVERRLALTQSTVDNANLSVYWADAGGKLIYLNAAARNALDLGARELNHLHIGDISPTIDHANWTRHWESVKRLGSLHFETEHQRRDGRRFPVEVHASHLAFDEQEFYIALVHDISERRSVERQLRQSATVFECTAEAIVITDAEGCVVDVNPAFTDMLGYSRDEVIGETPRLWKSDRHDAAFYAGMWQGIAETGQWRGEIVNRHKDGSLINELITINRVNGEDGGPPSYVAVCTDISHIKQSQQQLAHLAHHDPLTGLPNRVLFQERLRHALDQAARRQRRVAVIFVDLDQFKHVNDSLGHSAGDRLLIEVSELLRSRLRQDDTVARIGGDEFTILIEDVDDKTQLTPVIEKLLAAFEHEFSLGGPPIRITPSLGVSISPDDGDDAETLMRNADAAMYRAKALGRNTYQFYTEELTALAAQRIQLDTALRKAIVNGEFRLLYQPQIDLVDGSVVGMEALLRWNSSELGFIPPDRFIPVAEDSGVILPLGEWILLEACRQAREWLDQGLLPGTLAVNISGVQVRRGDLVRVVKRVLAESGLPAERLELELTESFIMTESQSAIETLQELRELGLTLAVDDFGTGYSSLAYLKSLPVHLLKIDKSFIRDIPDDTNDMAITRAVIALARSLNLEIVAEGVETEVQRRFLLQEGCEVGQGYLFHRPLEAGQMTELLRVGAAQSEAQRQAKGNHLSAGPG
jgi:diguanylate cyclase (GGDEF)-like protein/PAS domain S-box-containing protein